MRRATKTVSKAIGVAAALALVMAPEVAHANEPRVAEPPAGAEADAQAPCGGTTLNAVHRYWDVDGVRRAAAHLWNKGEFGTSVASDDSYAGDGAALGVLVETPSGGLIKVVDQIPEDRVRVVECIEPGQFTRWKWVSFHQGTSDIRDDSLPWQDPI